MNKIDRNNVEDILRLTPLQEGILFHRLRQRSSAYFEQVCLRLEGTVDPACFREAWKRVTVIHEALRAVFRWEGLDHPVQIILKHHEPEIVVHESGSSLAELKRLDRERGFDFEGVPFRVTLCQLEPQRYAMLLSNHHILLDGWSTGLILSDLMEQYRVLAGGAAPVSTIHRARLKDFIKLSGARDSAGAEGFWREYLAGFEGGSWPSSNGFDGSNHEPSTEVVEHLADESLLAGLKGLATSQNVTLSAVLYTGWGLLLQKYANTTDIVFGSVVSGRDIPLDGILRSAGMFINTLPLRFRAEGETRLSECLRHVHTDSLSRADWQTTPLSDIQRWCALPPGEDLFDSLVVIENYPLDGALGRQEAPFRVTGHEVSERTHYGLTLTVETFERLHLTLAWREGVIDSEGGSRLIDHFINILKFMVRFPELTVAELDMLAPSEREKVYSAFNQTECPFPDSELLHDRIWTTACSDNNVNRNALTCGDETLTYRQLIEGAERVATRLREHGFVPGDIVAVSLPPSCELIVTLMGILKAGGAYLPLDPSFPEEPINFILGDAAAHFLIDGEYRRLHPAAADRHSGAAYLIYTSGSTGQPKGVWISHRNLMNFLTGMEQVLPISPDDVFLSLTTVSFDIFGLETWFPLSLGCKVVLGTREEQLDPSAAADAMVRHGVTVYQATPSRLRLQLERADFRSALQRLRLILIGGEALQADLLRQIQTLTRARIFNLYGPTETTIWSTVSELTNADLPDIGRPIANTRVYILSRTGSVQPPGLTGELCIGGEGVSLGYHRRDALTQSRFREERSLGRLYHTGDMAKWRPDGKLVCFGRMDEQLKIRGHRIEPGEIEAHLLEHPSVKEVVVVARERAGELDLVAFWVRDPAWDASAESLQSFLARRLPPAIMPAAFVPVDSMPLTGNGKIDRKALLNPFEAAIEPQTTTASLSSTEQKIAGIWREILKIDSIGPEEHFFNAGGNSFGLIRLHGKLTRAFTKKIAVADLFTHSTVRAQAAFLSAPDQAANAKLSQSHASSRVSGSGDIAVIGMAGRFPGAANIAEYWELIRGAKEGLRTFSDEELLNEGIDPELVTAPQYVKVKGWLDGADRFDAAFFGVTPKEAESMDPQIRLLAECAWEALENAGYTPGAATGPIGIFAGSSANYHWLDYVGISAETTARFDTMIRNEKDYLAPRLAYMLNLTGPAVTVQTACSTSLVAIDLAAQSLLAAKAEMALAGGAGLTYPLMSGYLHEEGMIFSPDGHCRAFDAAAAGTVCGNGVGMVLLKPLEAALADGDHIHVVLKGSAVNNDGAAKIGFTAPSVEGQAGVITQAQRRAGVDAESIGYVETHGSATPLGDPVEVAALTRAFNSQRRGFCALGSVKTNVGHLDAAAGVAGFIKTVLALEHKTLPPSVHYERPNPEIDFHASPFYVNAEAREWRTEGLPRRAGVSSFGIGGSNAHAVLEEAPTSASRPPRTTSPQLLVLSARTPSQLDELSRNLAQHFAVHPELDPADVAFTLHAGRKRFPYRRMLVCEDLRTAAAALTEPPKTIGTATEAPPLVFLFGGLGSQYAGMCRGLYESEPSFREPMDRCFDILRPTLDLKPLLFGHGQEDSGQNALHRFDVAQAAVFSCEYALAQMLMSWGLKPSAVGGYSFGEYVAASIAGVFTLEDALAIVCERGRLLMAAPPGAMLSVPLPSVETAPMLTGSLAVAIDNGPSCVISGPRDEVAEFAARMKRRKIWTTPVEAERAVHSPLMLSTARDLEDRIARYTRREPSIPFVSNVTGAYFEAGQTVDPSYWARHLCGPVRFAEMLRTLMELPNAVFVEIGPGRDLTNLVQYQLEPSSLPRAMGLIRRLQESIDDRTFLLNRLGQLFLRGVEMDARAFYRGRNCRRTPLPSYPFERQRFWPVRPGRSGPGLKTAGSALEQASSPDSTLYFPAWKQAPRLRNREMPPARWLIFSDDSAVASALAAELERRGQAAALRGPSGEDLADLRLADGSPPDHVIHLLTVPKSQKDPFAALDRLTRDGFHHLLELSRALTAQAPDHKISIHVVTEGIAEIGGEAGPRPEAALLQGPARIIPFEYPNLLCHLIDIRLPDPTAQADPNWIDALLTECVQPKPPKEIALRGRSRWELVYDRLTPASAEMQTPLRHQGVYLITGGFGALGLALAHRLAERYQANLILVGRNLKRPEVLREVEALGCRVAAEAADVTDAAAMRAVVERTIANFGAIHGVFHLAGIADGGLIQNRTREQNDAVLAPKTRGVLALDEALNGVSPDFVVLYSSINAIVSPYGQVAYASANAFLDSFALRRSGTGSRTISINWDTWKEAGMAVSARVGAAGDLEYGLSTQAGLDTLDRILRGCEPRVVVSMSDLPSRLARHERDGGIPTTSLPNRPRVTQSPHSRPELAVAFAPPGNELEERIGVVLAEYLSLQKVGIDDNFNDLGASSLDLIQIGQRLKRALRRDVAVVDLYKNPTVRALARRFDRESQSVNGVDNSTKREPRPRDTAGLARRRELGKAARVSHG